MTEIVNRYPVGIQTFGNIREGHYLYVDKTPYIVDFRKKKRMKYLFQTVSYLIFNLMGDLIPYSAEGKRLVKVGINYDSQQRTLGDWIIKNC